MLHIDIPGRGPLELQHLVLDANGTVAMDGALLPGVAEAVRALGVALEVTLVTADTRGSARSAADALGARLHLLTRGGEAEQKRELVATLGAERSAAVGNGANDRDMLREAAVGICVIGREGAARDALDAADLVVTDVLDALGMLADPARLVATLRR